MTLAVEVQFAIDTPRLPTTAQLSGWARAAWRGPKTDAEVVLRLSDEAESRQLNQQFRGRDGPTNVLSFAYDPIPGIAPTHIGDLLLCAPVVQREAAEQGKRDEAHWAHMVVHGILHLQGYDHEDEQQAGVMESLETAILTELGFPAPYADDAMT